MQNNTLFQQKADFNINFFNIKKGFSLIELLVVIVIMGILSVVMYSVLGNSLEGNEVLSGFKKEIYNYKQPGALCGNGILDWGEECDGHSGADYSCNTNCKLIGNKPLNTCGDSIHEIGESCDDGNKINEDGCSSNCHISNDIWIDIPSQGCPNNNYNDCEITDGCITGGYDFKKVLLLNNFKTKETKEFINSIKEYKLCPYRIDNISNNYNFAFSSVKRNPSIYLKSENKKSKKPIIIKWSYK